MFYVLLYPQVTFACSVSIYNSVIKLYIMPWCPLSFTSSGSNHSQLLTLKQEYNTFNKLSWMCVLLRNDILSLMEHITSS